MTYDVFIERPRNPSPDGRERLGRALAIRFRLDEAVVLGALEAGRRLRAKANLEEPVARRLAEDLEALGAIVAVAPHVRSSSHNNPPVPASGGHPPAAPRLVSEAKISPEQVVTFSTHLTLATLDGEDARTPLPTLSRAEPMGAAPPPPSPSGSAPTRRPSVARDAFLPPGAENEMPLELVERPSRSARMAPAPSVATHHVKAPTIEARRISTSTPPVGTASLDHTPAPVAPASRQSFAELLTRDPRGRWVSALLIGLVVGFVLAQVYASFAEDKLDDIGAQLAREPAPTTDADHALLMEQFDLAEKRVRRVRSRIVLVSGVLWLLAGAAATAGYWRLTTMTRPARPPRVSA